MIMNIYKRRRKYEIYNRKNVILENLMNVARAISTKNVIPILNGIKFELKEEGLYLTASDSELTIKSFIENKEIKKC